MSQTTMSIRVDSNLKQRFDVLCDEFGISNTSALTLFIKAVVRERRIPFEIRAVSIEDSRKQALLAFDILRAEAAESGVQGLSLDSINAIINEVRNGKE